MNAKCSLSIVVDVFCFVDVVSLITDNTKPTITVNFKRMHFEEMTNSGVIVDNSNCKYKATNVGHHNFEI